MSCSPCRRSFLARAPAGREHSRHGEERTTGRGAAEQLASGQDICHSDPSSESTTNVDSGLQLSVSLWPGEAPFNPSDAFWPVDGESAAAGLDDVLRRDADVGLLDDRSLERVRLPLSELDLLGPDPDGDLPRAARERVRPDPNLRPAVQTNRVGTADRARNQVGHSEEARDERRRRRFVQLGRRAELLDAAAVHDRNLVGHRHGLFLVVGDVDEGDSDVVLDPLQLELHLFA